MEVCRLYGVRLGAIGQASILISSRSCLTSSPRSAIISRTQAGSLSSDKRIREKTRTTMSKNISNLPKILGILSVLAFSLPGCATFMSGASEAGIGQTISSRWFVYHTTDGDKEEADASTRLDITGLSDLIEQLQGKKSQDEEPDESASPSTSE